jgi:hypothetical protein
LLFYQQISKLEANGTSIPNCFGFFFAFHFGKPIVGDLPGTPTKLKANGRLITQSPFCLTHLHPWPGKPQLEL